MKFILISLIIFCTSFSSPIKQRYLILASCRIPQKDMSNDCWPMEFKKMEMDLEGDPTTLKKQLLTQLELSFPQADSYQSDIVTAGSSFVVLYSYEKTLGYGGCKPITVKGWIIKPTRDDAVKAYNIEVVNVLNNKNNYKNHHYSVWPN